MKMDLFYVIGLDITPGSGDLYQGFYMKNVPTVQGIYQGFAE